MVLLPKLEGKGHLSDHRYNAYTVPNNEKNQAPAKIHSQALPAKNTLKYYYEFCIQTTFKITSLIH
jgi:hypothetical protein